MIMIKSQVKKRELEVRNGRMNMETTAVNRCKEGIGGEEWPYEHGTTPVKDKKSELEARNGCRYGR